MKLRNILSAVFIIALTSVSCKEDEKAKSTSTPIVETNTQNPVITDPIVDPLNQGGGTINLPTVLTEEELIAQLRERNNGNLYKFVHFTQPINSHASPGNSCEAADQFLGRVQDCGGKNCSGKNRLCTQVVEWKQVSPLTPVVVDVVVSPYNIINPTPKCPAYTITQDGTNRQLVLNPYEGIALQLCDHTGVNGCANGTRQICSYSADAKDLFLGTTTLQRMVMTPEMQRTDANAAEYDKYHLSSAVLLQQQQIIDANASLVGSQKTTEMGRVTKELIQPICKNLEDRDRAAGVELGTASYEPLKHGHSFFSNCSHASGNGVGCKDARVICGVYKEI